MGGLSILWGYLITTYKPWWFCDTFGFCLSSHLFVFQPGCEQLHWNQFFLTAQNLKFFVLKLQNFSNDAFQSNYDLSQVN